MGKWLTGFIALGLTGLAQADAMRCGTRLVTPGDSKVEVLNRCGEPLHKETVKLLTTSHERDLLLSSAKIRENRLKTEETVAIDQWTYKLEAGKFLRILTFRGNVLESITFGDKP